MRVSVDGDGVEDTRAASMISKGSYCSSHCLRTVWEQRCCLFTCISLVLAHNRALINICWMHTGENMWIIGLISYSSVQLLSRVWLFVTPWTAACQAALSITNSWSLLKLMSINSRRHPTISSSVVPFFSCLQLFPISGSFPMNQFFTSGSPSTGASALASVLPVNIQDWFPLGLTGLISLQSKGLSRVFFSTTIQKHQFFSTQLSLWSNSHIHISIHTGKTISLTIQTFACKVMPLLFNTV